MASGKRCHYEVLGLPCDCTADEIRSAYRRLALQRHPDKLVKPGLSQEEATAQFQELQHAYEVLSDPKERTWYDSHRSQILFSDPTSVASSVVPDLFSFFSNTVYSGYSDTGKGFYKVYSDVFDKIQANEVNFARKMGFGVVKQAPVMGNLDSPYALVTAFYGYWLGFSTVMDFSWVDEYDVMVGPNRKNNKVRKKARKEYNDTVRRLADFVKKRDKRVIDMKEEEERERKKRMEMEKKKKEEEKERKKRLEKERKDRAMAYEEPEWGEWVEGWIEEEFYCVLCEKKFKSEKQWKNHEQSKKHKEKMAMPEKSPATTTSAQVVGNAFVEQYYRILHQSPNLLHRFYKDSSFLSRSDSNDVMKTVTSTKAINEKIISLNYEDCTVEIKTADAQGSYEKGLIVLVTGWLTGKDNVRRKFSQTFFLAPQDNGYYVLNDIFRYIEENDAPQLNSDSARGSSDVHEAEGHSIYIRNLPFNATVEQLEDVFKKFGPIKHGGIQVRSSKHGFCFGFVEFEELSSVHSALEASPITVGERQAVVEKKRITTRVSGSGRRRYSSGRGGWSSEFRKQGEFSRQPWSSQQPTGWDYEFRKQGEFSGQPWSFIQPTGWD